MFTGIVHEVGRIKEVSPRRLSVGAGSILGGLSLGDSVSVSGACLTVVEIADGAFAVELSQETLSRTNLGRLQPGDGVNLEPALTPSTSMGGHIVQGHVDGTGTVLELSGPPEARVLRVEAPEALARYIVEKGFIAVDGISLTVTGVGTGKSPGSTAFSVAVIPYTLEQTVLRFRGPGDPVNLEVDIVAKYVERLLGQRA